MSNSYYFGRQQWTPLAGEDAGEPLPQYSKYGITGYGGGQPYEMQGGSTWQSRRDSLYSPIPPLQTYGSRQASINSSQSFRSRDSVSPYSGVTPLLSKHLDSAPSIQSSIHRTKSWRQKTFSGWKVGVTFCAILAAVVFLVNVSLTIWAVVKFGVRDGLGTVLDGSCGVTKKMSLWLHLAINVLSSALLSASNYCMQILSSPTRAEVDKAHAKQQWLDIGLPSVRNLRKVASSRVLLWWCLGLSSVPLHLMYNSAVFSSLAANEYDVLVVAPEFLTGGSWNDTASFFTSKDTIVHMQSEVHSFERLDKATCVKSYGTEFVSARRNVVVVSTTSNLTNALYWATESQLEYSWICGGYSYGNCNPANILNSIDSWTIRGNPVDYCLSEVVEESCRLQFSLYIMIIVIFCNFVKSTSMTLTVFKHQIPTLVTLGDAVESFLEFPDVTTEGMCTVGKVQILKTGWKQRGTPISYRPDRNFWFRAASLKRWLICNTLWAAGLGGSGFLLYLGITNLGTSDHSLKALYKLGLGAVTSSALIEIGLDGPGAGPLLANVLLANLPQAVLSFLYLMYNGIFTCMLSADEWSRFAYQRKTLRVTSPVGKQRCTYYLQLPYTFALPLLVLSGSLHWLLSQSIFLARVTVFNAGGGESKYSSISTCGYSCIAIIFVIGVASVTILGSLGFGFRRYPAGIPLAAGCSAAISAACHPPIGDEDVSVLPVKWGVIPDNKPNVGHCSFSCNEVSDVVPGHMYAGEIKKRTPSG